PRARVPQRAHVAEDGTRAAEGLRSHREQLGQVRRAVRAIEPAAQAIAREERPVDQRLPRIDAADRAVVRIAAAELDLEMLDEGGTVADDRNQQLAVDLRDVELAA